VADEFRRYGFLHRVEFFTACQGGDQVGQETESPHADHIQFAARDRLCRSVHLFTRDAARGVDPQWVREMYNFAVRPDATFYFRVPVQTSLGRLMNARRKIKYYEAGMDLGLSSNIEESYVLFQDRVLDEYDQMSEEFAFNVMDAEKPIDVQQHRMRRIVETELSDYFVRYQLESKQAEEDAAQEPTPERLPVLETAEGKST